MKLDQVVTIDDMRILAKRRLPKIAFDFIEGGVEGEDGLERNEQAFRKHSFVPRYLVDVSAVDQSTELFGRTYSSPYGISPTGALSLFRPGGDMMLARAARDANIPFIMSGSATDTIENLGKTAPDHGWYQLYMAQDRSIAQDMIRRAADAGLSTLALTVDVPARVRRERNIRNGFTRPLKMSLKTRLEALRHPAWMAGYLRHGTPMLANWRPYAPDGASADEVAGFSVSQTVAVMNWADVENFRKLWPGNLVIKGIMHPDDAFRAAELGVDGLLISNHGARQFDRAPSPLEVLPAIDEAVGGRMTLMMDGGIRRGADILVALALGAKFVFMGRPTLYGAAVAGQAGASHIITVLRQQIKTNMEQMGCTSLDQLPDFLMWDDPDDLRRNAKGNRP